MSLNRYSLLKYALVPLIAWFFYWTVIYEIYVLSKPIQSIFLSSYQNWILLIILVALEAIVIYKQARLNRQTVAAETKAAAQDPWTKTRKNKGPQKDSFRFFMRGSVDSYSERIESTFDTVWRSRIHRRIFFKLKRICFGCLCLLYLALAFMSLSNPAFFILFVVTAYAFLENLLLAKHYQFIKRRVKENEGK